MDEIKKLEKEFVQLARMAINEQWDDVRLYVARVLRRYRSSNSDLAEQLNELLKANPARRSGVLRKRDPISEDKAVYQEQSVATDLLRELETEDTGTPLMGNSVRAVVEQLIVERKNAALLRQSDLKPSCSAIFEGPPGVGKTLTARWIASQLDRPLLVLDLASVMSSYLGRTGTNIRAAFDYAKAQNAVLLLDEIDAIAKRRSDDADIGELKRLVTVVLQEVDEWPESSLLLAATNHAELIDPALWRRFDSVVHFELPEVEQRYEAFSQYLGKDFQQFAGWIDSLAIGSEEESFSNIEKAVNRMRRSIALSLASVEELAVSYLSTRVSKLDKKSKILIASRMSQHSDLSQHRISEITGVSRDTIRKYVRQAVA